MKLVFSLVACEEEEEEGVKEYSGEMNEREKHHLFVHK